MLISKIVTANQNVCDVKRARNALGVLTMIPVRMALSEKLQSRMGESVVQSAIYAGRTVTVYLTSDKQGYIVLAGVVFGRCANLRGLARCPPGRARSPKNGSSSTVEKATP